MAWSSIRLDRILCAVTFSPASRPVVARAASLAEPYDGEVRLLHVLPSSDERAAAQPDADTERALTQLFALARGLSGRPRISAAATEGDTVAEILRHARLVHADLIAIGMHAQDGSVSSLAARIAVHAPCPVLAVDENAKSSDSCGAPYQLVVAIDFRPASLAAADYAFAVARTMRAQVTAVHVLPERWEGRQRNDANVDETRRLVEDHFRRLLQTAVSAISGSARDRSELVASGRPCVEIVRIAHARNADLIVMGIDAGQTSLEAFGGTTNGVMQFAGRSVLLVPERLFQIATV